MKPGSRSRRSFTRPRPRRPKPAKARGRKRKASRPERSPAAARTTVPSSKPKSWTTRRPEALLAPRIASARPRGRNDLPAAGAAGLDSRHKQNNQKKKTMAMNLKPLGDRVLVEPVEEKETKKGGIIIPDSAKEKPMESLVIAVGTGKTDDNGKKVPFEVKKGDRVLVSKYGGTEIKLDGKDYKILNSDDILAVIE